MSKEEEEEEGVEGMGCDVCHQQFLSSDLLALHSVLNHGSKICEVCSKVWNSVKRHECLPNPDFYCDTCNTNFDDLSELKTHKSTLHDIHLCFLCLKEVHGEKEILLHFKETHFVHKNGFLVSDELISSWNDDKNTDFYSCNVCMSRQVKSEVIDHFLRYHHFSVLPLSEKLVSQNLGIVVSGTIKNSGKYTYTDLPHSLPTLTDCFQSGIDIVNMNMKSAVAVCKLCLKCFDNTRIRDDHISTDHSQLPCMLGCSSKVVFTDESKLNEHCLNIHDVKQCCFCNSYIRCIDGMIVEHLRNDHKYSRSSSSDSDNITEFLSIKHCFQLYHSRNRLILECRLCDESNFKLEINHCNDLFTHFSFHNISLKYIIIFLEETPLVLDTLKKLNLSCEKNNEINDSNDSDNKTQNSESGDTGVNKGVRFANNVSCDDDCSNNQGLNSNDSKSKAVKLGNKKLSVKKGRLASGENFDSVNENVKTEWCSSEDEEVSKVKNGTDEDDDDDEDEEDEEDDVEDEDVEDEEDEVDEDDGVVGSGGEEDDADDDEDDDDEDEDDDDDEDDGDDNDENANKSENKGGVNSILKYDLFNVKAEVDPCEVECVVTDTSDVDTDDEVMVEYANDAFMSQFTDNRNCATENTNGFLSKRHRSAVNSKSLPGLNRMEVGLKGFYCEICDGKFDPHEGMRELIKHMKTLHGFNCNFNGQKLSSVFKFNKSKSESSIKMQPGLVCPVCMMGWMSKRLLREHVTLSHGPDWIKTVPSSPLAYQCRHCNLGFWKASECHAHERDEHPDMNTIQCHVCSDTMLRKVSMNRHLKTCHPKEKLHSYISYKCKQCTRLFPTYKLLDQHVRTKHPLCVVFRCPHCHSPLKNKKSLYDHIKMQHRVNQTYQCEECGRTLYSKRALSIHTQLKHHQTNKLRFKCRLCEKFFESKDARKTHYRIDHAQENIFHCRECGKGFASKSGLYGHKQVHLMSIDAFKCEHCNKEFSRRDSYNEHLQIHTGPRHRCPHCAKEFVQRSNMIRHIRIHTGEKPYKCSHCDKTFSDKGACNAHIRVHTREEVSPCPYCNKTFSKKQKLKYHIRKHTGEGLVACEVCGKSFTHNFLLKEHRLIHDQQTQSLCGECGRAFNSSKYLVRHIQAVHRPTHLFTCPVCSKTFTQQPRLKQHMMTHATYKRLQCRICEKGYTTLNSLRKHLTSVHELKKDSQEYKDMFEKLSNERAAFLEFHKQMDLHRLIEGTPISKLPKDKEDDNNGNNNNDVSNSSTNNNLDDDNTSNNNNDESGATVSDVVTSSSSIGQRILRNSRKSRPKCLEELEVESSSDEEYPNIPIEKFSGWDDNSFSSDNEKFKPGEGEIIGFQQNKPSNSNKITEKSSKKRRVENIAHVLKVKGRKTNKSKTNGSDIKS